MTSQFCYWNHWNSYIKDDDFRLIHHDCSQVVRVLFIPRDPQKWGVLAFIDDGWVFEISQIEMSNWTVLSSRREHTLILSETDIVNSLIVSYKLCLDNLLLDVPNRTCRINAWCTNHIQVLLIPIEARQWRAKFSLLHQPQLMTLKDLTFERRLLSDTDLDSSPTSQMRKYSPEVAIKSLWVPA